MINLDNLKQKENWPTTGFLYGENLLPQDLLDELLGFDYTKCVNIPQYWNDPVDGSTNYVVIERGAYPVRSTVHMSNATFSAMQKISKYLDNVEILGSLIDKSLEGTGLSLVDICGADFETIKQKYHYGLSLMWDDPPGFFLGPHRDGSDWYATLQIYLDPEEADLGTTFHDTYDWSIREKLPFIRNTGYFQINSSESIHSLDVIPDGYKRRSFVHTWKIR
jgi:hypothetical protein